MKILQVNKFFYLKGGSEAYLFSLIDGLKALKYYTAEFSMFDKMNYFSHWNKYFVSKIDYDTKKTIKKIKAATKILYSLEAKTKIASVLNKFQPDLVHLHIFQHQLSASIIPEIKKRNIPIVYTAHDLKSVCPNYKMLTNGIVCEECKGHRYYNCFKNRCVKDSYVKSSINMLEMYFHLWCKYYDMIDLIITPSKFYKKKLIEWRFSSERVIHVPNFINENKFLPKYSNKGYFIYLGRLSEEKGILTLVNAMKKVKKGKLIIIGTGPLENAIKQKITTMRLANVEMVGFQSGESLNNYIINSMFSVIPSEWYENGPISILENFACGKPVIGAEIGGIPEHITIGKDGFIFQPKNPLDLAEKINFLLEHKELLPIMGAAARKKAETVYSRKKHLEAITQIYKKLFQ